MAWQKINEKLYRITLNDELTDIKVPYAVVENVFTTFVTGGGIIDSDGKVQTDPILLITNFRKMADILLTKYSKTGEIEEAGNCSMLSATEIKELFEVSVDVLENFIAAISAMSEKKALIAQSEEESKKKTKKTA